MYLDWTKNALKTSKNYKRIISFFENCLFNKRLSCFIKIFPSLLNILNNCHLEHTICLILFVYKETPQSVNLFDTIRMPKNISYVSQYIFMDDFEFMMLNNFQYKLLVQYFKSSRYWRNVINIDYWKILNFVFKV